MLKYFPVAEDINSWLPCDPDTSDNPVFVLNALFQRTRGPMHSHKKAQLMYASDCAITVYTDQGLWLTPPNRAVWIPSGVPHHVSAAREYTLLTLYADEACLAVSDKCCVLEVDDLMRELLKAAAAFGDGYGPGTPEARLVAVIIDRLLSSLRTPLFLPHPKDPRLQRMSSILRAEINNNDSDCSLDDIARRAGLSPRTAARLFKKETRMTFQQWRQQLRLIAAVEKLADGKSVTEVAFEVGYRDVSSFIQVFKQLTGKTPSRYFAGEKDGPPPLTPLSGLPLQNKLMAPFRPCFRTR